MKPLPDYAVVEDEPQAKPLPDYAVVEEDPAPAVKPVASTPPAPPPAAPPSLSDRVAQLPGQLYQHVSDQFKDEDLPHRLDRAATNALEGATFGGAGAVAPYLNAAVDTVNPWSDSKAKTFRDRVMEQKKLWDSKLDPESVAAASVVPSVAMGGTNLAANAALNAMMALRGKDKEGKDLSNPDELVDAGRDTAIMTTLPYAAGQLVRTAQPMFNAIKNSGAADTARRGANIMASRAVGLNKAQLNQLPIDAPQTIGQVLNDFKIPAAGDTAVDLAPKLSAAKSAVGDQMGDVLKTADTATGGSGRDIRAKIAELMGQNEGARTALKNDALFDAGKVTERQAAHASQAQDFVAAAKAGASKLEEDTVARPGSLNWTVDRDVRAGADALPDRVPDTSPIVPPKDGFGEPKSLASLPHEARIPAANRLVDEKIPPTDPRTLTADNGFDAFKFVDRARQEIMPKLEDPVLAPLKAKMQRLLTAYEKRAAEGMSFSEANRMKSTIQGTINKFQDAKANQKALLELQGTLDTELEDQLKPVVGDRFKDFVKSKANYGALANASKANNQLIRKEAGNMPAGLVELGSAGAGAGLGALGGALASPSASGALAALGALAAPVATRQVRLRGPATAAVGLSRFANTVDAAPGVINDWANKVEALAPGIVKALGPEKTRALYEWIKAQGPKAPTDE